MTIKYTGVSTTYFLSLAKVGCWVFSFVTLPAGKIGKPISNMDSKKYLSLLATVGSTIKVHRVHQRSDLRLMWKWKDPFTWTPSQGCNCLPVSSLACMDVINGTSVIKIFLGSAVGGGSVPDTYHGRVVVLTSILLLVYCLHLHQKLLFSSLHSLDTVEVLPVI